jgi:hypothetical protein
VPGSVSAIVASVGSVIRYDGRPDARSPGRDRGHHPGRMVLAIRQGCLGPAGPSSARWRHRPTVSASRPRRPRAPWSTVPTAPGRSAAQLAGGGPAPTCWTHLHRRTCRAPPVPSPKSGTGAPAVPRPAPDSCVSTSRTALPSPRGIACPGNWPGPGHGHAGRGRQAFMFHRGAGQRDGVVAKLPGLALQSTAGRVGASLQAGEEDGYGSDDAVHDRGLPSLYRRSL